MNVLSKIKGLVKWIFTKENWSDSKKKPRFYATDKCDSCKICYDACPTGHIKWVNDRPEWEKPCLLCASCSTVCPLGAISYGVPPYQSSDTDPSASPSGEA